MILFTSGKIMFDVWPKIGSWLRQTVDFSPLSDNNVAIFVNCGHLTTQLYPNSKFKKVRFSIIEFLCKFLHTYICIDLAWIFQLILVLAKIVWRLFHTTITTTKFVQNVKSTKSNKIFPKVQEMQKNHWYWFVWWSC